MTRKKVMYCEHCMRLYNAGPDDIEAGEIVEIQMNPSLTCGECLSK